MTHMDEGLVQGIEHEGKDVELALGHYGCEFPTSYWTIQSGNWVIGVRV